MLTRRGLAKSALTAIPVASALAPNALAQNKVAKNASRFGGVPIAVQTYSYRTPRDFSKPLDLAGQKRLVAQMTEATVNDGINACEFWIAFIEPTGPTYSRTGITPAVLENRNTLRKWRALHPTTEFGKGDAPIKEILQLMKHEKCPFAATIEYEYKSDRPAVEEVRWCVEYAKAALA